MSKKIYADIQKLEPGDKVEVFETRRHRDRGRPTALSWIRAGRPNLVAGAGILVLARAGYGHGQGRRGTAAKPDFHRG